MNKLNNVNQNVWLKSQELVSNHFKSREFMLSIEITGSFDNTTHLSIPGVIFGLETKLNLPHYLEYRILKAKAILVVSVYCLSSLENICVQLRQFQPSELRTLVWLLTIILFLGFSQIQLNLQVNVFQFQKLFQ